MNTSSAKRNSDETSSLAPGSDAVSELALDLSALRAGTPGSLARWASRPAVLRRVALMLADRIPAEATRVIAGGEGATVLATAVALTAGLPFAVIEGEAIAFGEAHAGEEVSVVAIDQNELARARAQCEKGGMHVRHSQSVFGAAGLFTADEHGRVEEGAPV